MIDDIMRQVDSYWSAVQRRNEEFIPGETIVPASGKVIEADDMQLLVESCLDGWLTAGRFADKFEHDLARYLGSKSSLLVNSGSSANLLAVATLLDQAPGLEPGSTAITAAAGFPTTVNPIVQLGLKPYFIDIEIGSYVPSFEAIEEAIKKTSGRGPRMIILAHTLGNPWPVQRIKEAYPGPEISVIEDNCDALGSLIGDRKTGSFGDLATQSFYPAHHITAGEGGALVVNGSGRMTMAGRSLRDWGRSCWCKPGRENTCNQRFEWKCEGLGPDQSYDHKYIYDRLGYNLKATDMQAALLVSQLQKADRFASVRRRNFRDLDAGLRAIGSDGFFVMPRATEGSDPAWFGFPLTVREDAGFTRAEVVKYLNEKKVGTRYLFAGNIVNQPAYRGLSWDAADLRNSDRAMRDTFWVGVWHGLTEAHIAYITEVFYDFLSGPGR
jgi:CDP-6-deoxy-D-xylo-4-hexulose-3-dehydrase